MLARRLRPAGFDALVGQDHVVRALSHALDTGRVHHAYLFTGTRGVGKTTIARILAKALNCEQGVSAKPCEVCSVCTEIKENRFIDLIEVDAASRTGVDDTRDLLENAQYMPSRGRYKVYLIDEVHMLSTASFNALLKTLEEPPEHVKFLLATTDPKKVPVTVLSRCLQFQLKNMSRGTIVDYLSKVLSDDAEDEAIQFEEEALEIIAQSAQGSMRDALSLTDQALAYGQGQLNARDVEAMLGVAGSGAVAALIDGLVAGDASALLALCAELEEKNADFTDLNRRLLQDLHNMAVKLATGDANVPLGPEEIQLFYQIALTGLKDIDFAPEPRTGFEMTLLRMLAFAPDDSSPVPPRGSKHTQSAAVEPASNDQGSPSESAPLQPDVMENTSSPGQDGSAPVAAVLAAVDIDPQPSSVENIEKVSEPAVAPSDGPLYEGKPWHEIVAQLNIGGVSKSIAQNTNLVSIGSSEIHLLLDEQHEMLLGDNQVKQLERALGENFGDALKLTVTTGTLSFESPAQRDVRIAKERQAQAEETIGSDQNVAQLLQEFDARVVEVKPT